jgi:hypothetical protein
MGQRPYLKDRLIEDHPAGFAIIVPVDNELPVPLVCVVCDHVMRSRDDEISYFEFGCCDRCSQLWAYPRRQAWLAGWRPSVDEVKAAEIDRRPLNLKFHID